MAVVCPKCESDDLGLVELRADERRVIRCESCQHEWVRGEARRPPVGTPTIEALRRRFDAHGDVAPAIAQRVELLKSEYLQAHPRLL